MFKEEAFLCFLEISHIISKMLNTALPTYDNEAPPIPG
jgi:hypothetical protein